jgi:hypothetical protein
MGELGRFFREKGDEFWAFDLDEALLKMYI